VYVVANTVTSIVSYSPECDASFCGEDCAILYARLQSLITKKSNFSNFMQRRGVLTAGSTSFQGEACINDLMDMANAYKLAHPGKLTLQDKLNLFQEFLGYYRNLNGFTQSEPSVIFHINRMLNVVCEKPAPMSTPDEVALLDILQCLNKLNEKDLPAFYKSLYPSLSDSDLPVVGSDTYWYDYILTAAVATGNWVVANPLTTVTYVGVAGLICYGAYGVYVYVYTKPVVLDVVPTIDLPVQENSISLSNVQVLSPVEVYVELNYTWLICIILLCMYLGFYMVNKDYSFDDKSINYQNKVLEYKPFMPNNICEESSKVLLTNMDEPVSSPKNNVYITILITNLKCSLII